MKLRPADLLESVRQMSEAEKKDFVALLGDQLLEVVWNSPIPLLNHPIVSWDEVKADPMGDLRKAIAESHKYQYGPIVTHIPAMAYCRPSESTVDHFTQSDKPCPNCQWPMMQCESHYRCMKCGNVEHESRTNPNLCPECKQDTIQSELGITDDGKSCTYFHCMNEGCGFKLRRLNKESCND